MAKGTLKIIRIKILSEIILDYPGTTSRMTRVYSGIPESKLRHTAKNG